MDGIELVVFDMAGTTVNDEDSVNRCVRDTMAEFGLIVTRDEVNRVMGLPKPEAIRLLIESHGRKEDLGPRVAEIHGDFVTRSIAFYRSHPSVRPAPGALEVFRRLKEARILVALDTGFDRGITNVILDRLGWSQSADVVDTTITSDEVPRGRPHPDMIRALMFRLRVSDAARVAKVGDTPADLLEGTSAGCGLVVGVTCGTHTRAELEVHPHTHLIDDLREFPALLGIA